MQPLLDGVLTGHEHRDGGGWLILRRDGSKELITPLLVSEVLTDGLFLIEPARAIHLMNLGKGMEHSLVLQVL